ncbi:MAG: ABC transporter substrate-binding protein [Bacillota bacterium]
MKSCSLLVKRSFLLVLVLVLVLSSGVIVYSAGHNVVKSRMRLGEDIENLDPAHLVRGYDIALVLYNNLLKYKPGSSELVNDAAEEVNISEDGKVISFKLKEGIQFHKGYGEMTAEDVKFSFERIIDPDENSEYTADWQTLDRVEVTGKYTGEIILKEPLASLLVTTIPFTPGSIISKKAYEELGNKFATNPIGSGPYYMESWVPEQVFVLSRFEDYFDEKPNIEKIELYPISDTNISEMNFDKGDLDVTEISLDSIDRYENNSDVDVHILSTLKYGFIGFNHEYPPFDNIEVRKALRSAIDVDMIIDGAYSGVPNRANSMIAPGILGHWEDAPQYDVDIEKAKEHLAEAGHSDGFEVEMVTTSNPLYMNICQIVKENLREINVEVNIKTIETSAWYEYVGKESHPIMYFETFSLTLDPGYWVEWFTTEQVGKWNFLKWSNTEYDELADQAAVTMDLDEREEMYIEMQKIMDEDAAIIWLTNGAKAYVSNKRVDPVFLGHYNQYRYWEIVE